LIQAGSAQQTDKQIRAKYSFSTLSLLFLSLRNTVFQMIAISPSYNYAEFIIQNVKEKDLWHE
jgi:hypothetical protein